MTCRMNLAYECDCCGQCRGRAYASLPPEERPGAVFCDCCGSYIPDRYWNLNGEIIGECCIEDYLDREAVVLT